MTSNILPIAFTAASGAAGSIATGLMGASIIAGGLVAAVPTAMVLIVDKALDHLCADLSKQTTGLLKMGSWFVILAGACFVGSLVLGPLGLLFAIPCFLMIAFLLIRDIQNLRNEIAQINTENVEKAGKLLDDNIAMSSEAFKGVNKFLENLELILIKSPSHELKVAVTAKTEIVKATMSELNQIYDKVKQMDEREVQAVQKDVSLIQDKIISMYEKVLDEPFVKLLSDHGIHFGKEEEKEPEPSLI